MEKLTVICGFLGAWLLVAGPIYQAALELREQDIEEQRIREARNTVTPPEPVSNWWWLLPPLKVYFVKRRTRDYRRRYFAALSPEDSKALLLFVNKATAWLMVAGGGLLVAISETDNLSQTFHWDFGWFLAIVIVLLGISIGNTVERINRNDNILKDKVETAPTPNK